MAVSGVLTGMGPCRALRPMGKPAMGPELLGGAAGESAANLYEDDKQDSSPLPLRCPTGSRGCW
jgi:hypothetical protein